MNTDFRVSCGFPHHHKTKKLIRRIGKAGVFSLVCLWGHVAANRPSGDITGWTDEDFEIAGQWEGDPGKFKEALVECGFVDVDEDGNTFIHDWVTHNGYASSAEARSNASRASAMKRWSKKGVMPEQCHGNADALPSHSHGSPPIPSPSPSPSPSPKLAGYPAEFDEFWAIYPRKIDKTSAFKAWNARIKEGADPRDIIRAARAYITRPRRDPTYDKHPKTFLNPDWKQWISAETTVALVNNGLVL